jgi:hypothetical protein
MLLYSLHQLRILTMSPCTFIDLLADLHPPLPTIFIRPSREARRDLTPRIGDTVLFHFTMVSIGILPVN